MSIRLFKALIALMFGLSVGRPAFLRAADPTPGGPAETSQTRAAAEKGDAEAQVKLGTGLFYGQGMPQNYEEAAAWFRKAAEQGNAEGQNDLGLCLERGRGVNKDLVQAASWFRKAADQGNSIAQVNLALCYEKGMGVEKNSAETDRWYQKAADLGNSVAENEIGYRYDHGIGRPQNYAEAVNWFRKAAAQGNSIAEDNLGIYYENGKGIDRDLAEAVNWYRKAADQGNSRAQDNLSRMYEQGRGVQQDLVQAHVWANLAAGRGVDAARVRRDELSGKLTPEQLALAQKLATEWKPKRGQPTASPPATAPVMAGDSSLTVDEAVQTFFVKPPIPAAAPPAPDLASFVGTWKAHMSSLEVKIDDGWETTAMDDAPPLIFSITPQGSSFLLRSEGMDTAVRTLTVINGRVVARAEAPVPDIALDLRHGELDGAFEITQPPPRKMNFHAVRTP